MLPDPYPVAPWTAPCRGKVQVPGSKSLTNRALLLAALAEGETQLTGALFSRDSQLLVDGLEALGFDIQCDPQAASITVKGAGGGIPAAEADLFIGNAGTAARFLTAFVCLREGGRYTFDGDEEMYRRPMAGLIETLQGLGAEFVFLGEPGCFPFEVRTRGLPGGNWRLDASASSQMLSALLMVAPHVRDEVRITATGARPAFVQMTAGLMRQFGIDLAGDPVSGYTVPGGQGIRPPGGGKFPIEPDVTAASYFLTLPMVVGGSLTVAGLGSQLLQGDADYIGVLESLGLQIVPSAEGWTATAGAQPARAPREFNFETFSDTFLTLAAVAPLLPCPVRITGIGHTRHQETDRIHAMAAELQALGATAREEGAALAIEPFPSGFTPSASMHTVRTYRDHRVAMSFAILGCSPRLGNAGPWLAIADPACCGKTFPGFFGVLGNLYRNCHDKA
jgi:3-phosphoshikimate 1-carboxyvinyltransferase